MKQHKLDPLYFGTMHRNQPHLLVALEAMALVGLIGWVDYVTGWEYSLFVLYSVPIVIIVWETNLRLGIAFVVLCTMTWWLANFDSHSFQSAFGFPLALFGRFFFFVTLLVAASALKSRQELYQAQIESLEREKELEKNFLRASEREQQRIGRDLHDSLGPHLASIGYALTFLANDLRQRGQPEAAKAERIQELVSDAGLLLRDLVHGIYPGHINGSGLSMALEDFACTTSCLSGKPISYFEIGVNHINDSEISMHLYRIVQEAVSNALKHGDAKKVTIVLSNGGNSLHLAIVDDGKGMVQSPNGLGGTGLHSMRYRARTLGGDLKIDSNPSGGTIVSCEIPYPIHPPATPE